MELLENNSNWRVLFFWARISCLPFSLLGAIVCFLWARDLYGNNSGLIACSTWCFSPNILAWAPTIMPDIGATSLGLLFFYCLRSWLRNRNAETAICAGLALGVTLLSKCTWIILPPIALLLGTTAICIHEKEKVVRAKQTVSLFAMIAIGIVVLNFGYGFDGSMKRIGKYQFVSSSLGGRSIEEVKTTRDTANRFSNSWAGNVPVPFPEQYVLGIDWLKWEFEKGYPSFLCGEWKHGGWWYYYIYACWFKVPTGFVGLALLSCFATWVNKRSRVLALEEMYLFFPLVALFLLVSSQTGFSHHLRYLLPAFPFFFIFISKSVSLVGRSKPVYSCVLAVFLAWPMVSSASLSPYHAFYFNELSGSHVNGPNYLKETNIDAGQSIHAVKKWQTRNDDSREYFFSSPFIDTELAGIQCRPLPTDQVIQELVKEGRLTKAVLQPGFYIATPNLKHEVQFLNQFKPIDWIAITTPVYQLDDSDIEVIINHFSAAHSKP